MSIDLNSVLRDAADDSAIVEPATGQQLLARARQQSRRRRTRKIAVTTTVFATAGTVAATVVLGAGSLPGLGGADKTGPGTDPEVGTYHPIEVSFEEALERCQPSLAYSGYPTDAEWELAPDRPSSQPIYAGDGIKLVRADGSDKWDVCEVPYTAAERNPRWVDGQIADSQDTAALLGQCGAVAGYDFAGWEVVTAASGAQGAEAVLRSTNGYAAFCSLEPDFGKTWAGPPAPVDDPVHITDGQEATISNLSETEIASQPFEGFFEYNFFVGCGDTRRIRTDNQPEDGMLCSGSGALYERDGSRMTGAARLEVTIRGGGQTFEVPVVDGYYAARFLDPAADVKDDTYDYVIKDESGKVLGRGQGPN